MLLRAAAMSAPTLERVPIAAVVPSPDQNREQFDPDELAELAGSIEELGLLSPIVVRLERELAGDRYVLVGGERRLRACRDLLEWETIPAIVSEEPASSDSALRTLAENMNRADPTPLEEARGLAAVRDQYELEPAELARKLHKPARWIAGRLALLELAPDVAHFLETGNLPLKRAIPMARLDANRQRLALQAHERGISPDGFSELVARLEAEQAADSMFDTDTFLAVETYVLEAEEQAAELEEPAQLVRERPLGMSDVAELLEVKRGTVAQWRTRGQFLEPELVVGGSPAWWESSVRRWAAESGRA